MNKPTPARRSIYVGSHLDAFLATGGVVGQSVSERMDRLAQRYAALVQALLPQRWTPRDWWAVVQVVQEISVTQPADALLVVLRLRQRATQGLGPEQASLAYRFEALRLPEQLAVVDLAERAGHAKVEEGHLGAWLAEQGVA